jgi:hypothetical protein
MALVSHTHLVKGKMRGLELTLNRAIVVCYQSLAGIVASTPPGHGYVSLVRACVVRSLHLADHSSRGVLECVVCPNVNLEFDNREALSNQGLLRHGEKLHKMK